MIVDKNIGTKLESIYEKSNYNILRVKTNDFSFFTKIDKSEEVKKFDILNMIIITKDISFLDYLKGFNGKCEVLFKMYVFSKRFFLNF